MDKTLAIAEQDHYFRGLECFRKRSRYTSRNIDLLRQHLPEIIQGMLDMPPQLNQFNILSIGSGNGEPDFAIIKIVEHELLKSQDFLRGEIFNRAIEPNKESLSHYKEVLGATQPSSGDNYQCQVKFDLCQMRFQEYVEAKRDSMKFDMIHFVHSISYVEVEKALVECFEHKLKEKGIVMVIVGGKDLLHHTCLKQGHVWHDGHHKSWMTAEDIVQIADRYGWKHKLFNQDYSVDVTDVFEEESIDGNLLLDFLVYVKDFRKTTDPKQVKETLDMIKQLSTDKDGKCFGKLMDQLLIIYK